MLLQLEVACLATGIQGFCLSRDNNESQQMLYK